MSTRQAPSGGELIPALLAGLIDDAAVFPPGSAGLPQALAAHRGHRAAWYADLIGPLLLPASAVAAATLVAAAGPATPFGTAGPGASFGTAGPATPSQTAGPGAPFTTAGPATPSETAGPGAPFGTVEPATPSGAAGPGGPSEIVGPVDPSETAGSGAVASPIELGVVADSGLEPLASAIGRAGPQLRVRQIEIAVAKRGEDPQPGLRRLIDRLGGWPGLTGYAELPLTWGLLSALDTIAEARDGGLDIAPKFRVGGLAAELFPTPVELAAVICACRDRRLPFKLTAGLHHAVRHIDPETGFIHHGFLNILVGAAVAGDGAEVAEVAEALGGTDTAALTEAGRARRHQRRPLWVGFGSCSIVEPLTDLIRLGMIDGGYE